MAPNYKLIGIYTDINNIYAFIYMGISTKYGNVDNVPAKDKAQTKATILYFQGFSVTLASPPKFSSSLYLSSWSVSLEDLISNYCVFHSFN